MDTYNIEIDSIVESFKLDMFITEHENFMNIMYNRSEGVVNEAVLHEGFKDVIKELIRRAKEAIHKLIEKVREIMDNIKSKTLLKLNGGSIKNIPDDYEFDPVYDYNESVQLLNNLKESDKNMRSLIDMVIIDKGKIDSDKLDYATDMLESKYDDFLGNFDNLLPNTKIYYGKDIKSIYSKYSELGTAFSKIEYHSTEDLLNYLKKADIKIEKIGNQFVREYTFNNDREVDIRSNDKNIYTSEYKGGTKEFNRLMNRYIEFFSICCKMIIVYRKIGSKINQSITHFTNNIYKAGRA